MRIVHIDVDDIDNPHGGGQGRRTARLNEVISRYHDVTILSAGYDGIRETTKYGSRYLYTPTIPFPFSVANFVATLPFRLRMERYDLVIEDFTFPISTAMTPLYAGKPVIGCAQFLFAKEMWQKYHVPFHWIESAGLRLYKNVIAMTPSQALEMQRRAPQARVTVIPEGIEAEAFAVRALREDYVAFMGRMDMNQKGLDRLAEIARRIAPVELRVAGDGRDREAFLERVRGLDNVRFVGKVTADARLAFLAAARATVMPSRYETFGMVAIESLAVGTPVVCADIPNLSDAAGPLSTSVPEDDIAAYADALTALSAEVPSDAWIEEARRYAHGFVWSELAKKQLELYERVIDQNARARKA
jgi:glycogen synthase